MILLDAWMRLKEIRPAAVPELRIVGNGPLFEMLNAEIRRRDLTDCVTMIGPVSPEHVVRVVGKAIASILPSIRLEPCSRSVVESFAVGTPVIAAAMGGTMEMIKDGETGLLYTAGQVDELAECVDQLASTGPHLYAMRQAARTYFENFFHPKKDSEKLVKIYARVIKNNIEEKGVVDEVG
jgi:glycosyltransferase involved in cell wall biosynthesis